MSRLTRTRTVLMTLLVLAVLAMSAVAARSTFTDKDELRAHLRARFVAWTGSELTIDGPTRIFIFPRTRIEVENVKLRTLPNMADLERVDVKILRAEFGVWSLLWGEPRISRLTLFEPTFEVQRRNGAAAESASAATESLLLRALRKAPFSRMTIEQGALRIVGAEGTETLGNIQANLSLSQTGATALEGAFEWRGQTASFDLQTDAPTIVAQTASAPLRLTLGGNLISASIQGEATLDKDIRLTGTLDLSLPNTRKFAHWMGLDIAEGTGLGIFKADGDFNWVGQRIAFDNGTYVLDGNRAIGALAVLYGSPRPEIEGTLALQTLNLDQYLPQTKVEEEGETASRKSPEFTFPLMRHIDVDLRVSATQFEANSVEAGQTALTLAIKSGALSADFSILDLFDGRASGRLEIDTSQVPPLLHLSANLAGLAAKPCIETFSSKSPLEGGLDVEIDLNGRGRTLNDWFDGVSGTLAVSMAAGILDLDLDKVVTETRKGDVQGWTAAQGNATSFEQLATGFALEQGTARSESFVVQAGASKITGSGTIDIPSRLLNLRLQLPTGEEPPSPDAEQVVAELTHSLHIQGPWSEPTFRLEQKRADGEARIERRSALIGPPRAF